MCDYNARMHVYRVNMRSHRLLEICGDVVVLVAQVVVLDMRRMHVPQGTFYQNDIFNIFAQNVDSGYTLEQSPRRNGSNEYSQHMFWMKMAYPCIPQFHYITLGFKGVYITWACYRDVMQYPNV